MVGCYYRAGIPALNFAGGGRGRGGVYVGDRQEDRWVVGDRVENDCAKEPILT